MKSGEITLADIDANEDARDDNAAELHPPAASSATATIAAMK